MNDPVTFTRKPTVVGGQSHQNDWAVSYGAGQPLGRLILRDQGPAKHWAWATWTYPSSSGREDTLEAAQDALKAAVLALPPTKRCRHVTPGMMASDSPV